MCGTSAKSYPIIGSLQDEICTFGNRLCMNSTRVMFRFLFVFISVCCVFKSPVQENRIPISGALMILPLDSSTYIHRCDNANGLIYTSDDQAIIISTPPSDRATHDLITWVRDSLGKEITAYIIDRWHPDAMEGLDVVKEFNIPSYSSELTRTYALAKGLPQPENGFDTLLQIPIGQHFVICHYLGPAHTADGIVVYLPAENILFGGNEIRNYGGWTGNIADADLKEWSRTVQRVKQYYGNARIVVPGHGPAGGPELIEYTLELYRPFSSLNLQISTVEDFPGSPADTNTKIIWSAEEIREEEQTRLLGAKLTIKDAYRKVYIESKEIEKLSDTRFQSDSGRIRIIHTDPLYPLSPVDAEYTGLILELSNDEVGMTVVTRQLTPSPSP